MARASTACKARPPLDLLGSRIAAERLRGAGYDVVAAIDDRVLATLADEELLQAATREGRPVAAENMRDFDRILRSLAGKEEHDVGGRFASVLDWACFHSRAKWRAR